MEEKDIRPIPKYITERIRKTDLKFCPAQNGFVRFYAYLAVRKKELVKVTVAVKNYRKQWYCKQVAVHGVHTDICYVKDMEYCGYVGYGFRVGWHEEGIKGETFYERGWCYADKKYYDPFAPLINRDVVARFPEYRYSAYKEYKGRDIISYLRIYEKYPQAEYLIKLGLYSFAENVTVLKKVAADKRFCKWLVSHRNDVAINYYYAGTLLQAYKTGKPLDVVQRYQRRKKTFCRDASYAPIRKLFRGKLLERFFDYIDKQNTDYHSYLDYLDACTYLGLDMNLDKNRFPHDFKRWHDIRIDEYATAKAVADEKERAELYERFVAVAEKYLPLEYTKQNDFSVIIARSPEDLIREGEILNHCVGRMNYDQRVIREESLIFFIRDAAKPDTPFVTVEYSPKDRRILQCHGDHNQRPNDKVMNYIHNTWLPYANRTVKKLKLAA